MRFILKLNIFGDISLLGCIFFMFVKLNEFKTQQNFMGLIKINVDKTIKKNIYIET